MTNFDTTGYLLEVERLKKELERKTSHVEYLETALTAGGFYTIVNQARRLYEP